MGRNKGVVMIFDNVVPLQKGIDGKIYIDHYAAVIFYDEMGKNKYASVKMKRPTHKRSDKQNNWLHGVVRCLLPQFKARGIDTDFESLKLELKEHAIANSTYPYTLTPLTKKVCPKSSGSLSKEEFIAFQECIQKLLDEHHFWIYKKDDIGKYKSLYGASREYMKENFPELFD